MWEEIDVCTARMKVPGGWIVRSVLTRSTGVSVHQIFVPDPGHVWEIK